MPETLVLGKQKQKVQELKASLGYKAKPFLKGKRMCCSGPSGSLGDGLKMPHRHQMECCSAFFYNTVYCLHMTYAYPRANSKSPLDDF